jgi:hypothetical protein
VKIFEIVTCGCLGCAVGAAVTISATAKDYRPEDVRTRQYNTATATVYEITANSRGPDAAEYAGMFAGALIGAAIPIAYRFANRKDGRV